MKTIIFEDRIYKVTEKEYKKIKALEDNIKRLATIDYKQSSLAESDLGEYLDANSPNYRFIGTTDFHFQR
jgi:hypothetical protein